MPDKKPAKKKAAAKPKVEPKTVPKVGLVTQLAAIQTRYRNALLDAGDLPFVKQGARVREALATLLAEKAALGVKDGEESVTAE